jgi:ATP-dependent helicase/nuclease subunit B
MSTSPAPFSASITTPLASPVSFLAQTARELVERYGHGPTDELPDLVVVVPTRRAVVYLKNELALALPNGEPLWAPRVAAMEDYMVELAGVQVEEPIALQLLLFDILKNIDHDLDFDKFVGWAGLLLSDFSNLDQNLAQPHKVFEYLSQAKALERWDLEALPERSLVASRSFSFWDQLEKVYRELKRRMLAQHLAYPGLAYRLAVEKLEKQLASLTAAPPARHVFVGLGSLSRAEEKLIRLLLHAGRAEVKFDADPSTSVLTRPTAPASTCATTSSNGTCPAKLWAAAWNGCAASPTTCATWVWPTPACRASWPGSCWPKPGSSTPNAPWPLCCPTKPCCCPCSTACRLTSCPTST